MTPRRILPLLALLVLCLCSCRDERRTGTGPYGWTPLGEPLDSMTVELESLFIADVAADSLAGPVGRFVEAARDVDGAEGRSLFWQGRLLSRTGHGKEGYRKILDAIEATDSASYPYDIVRYRWTIERRGDFSDAEWYTHITEDIAFLTATGDLIVTSGRYMDLSQLMMEAGAPDRAVVYARKADSCLLAAGMEIPRLGNRINIANSLYRSGDTVAATAMLGELSRSPEVRDDSWISVLVDYDLFVVGRDTAALLRAWQGVAADTQRRGLRGLIAAHLADAALTRGDIDSAARCIRNVEDGMDYTTVGEHRAFMQLTRARTLAALGKTDEALRMYDEYAATTDSINRGMRRDELIARDTARRIDRIENAARDRERRQALVHRLTTGAILILLLFVAFIVHAYIQRLKNERLRATLETERSRRSELSLALSVREKDSLLSSISSRISDLASGGTVDTERAREIESALRTGTAAQRDSDEFSRTFAAVSPGFEQRLLEKYPGISTGAIRLASYIALGMDNRHIARVLNIRPESVKQARWRLRTQMRLDPGENLDTELRKLL